MFGVVNKTIVSIKNKPNDNSITVDEVFLGMIVELLWEDTNEYYYIKTDYGYKGYIDTSNVILDEKYVKSWMNKSYYIVTGEYIDILDGMSYDSELITSVMKGSLLAIKNKSTKTRTQVGLPDGKLGWIRNEFIKEKLDINKRKVDEVRDEIVKNALSYLNKQFKWGGKSPFGVDSSGFSSIIYLLSGLNVWRDSEFKEEWLVKIDKEELEPGDLIYGKEYMGIYLDDNKFISASSVYASVIIRSLDSNDSDYYDIFSSDKTIYACHKLLRG